MADLALAAAARYADREPAAIADHRADCCAVARAWLQCVDATFHRDGARAAPPAWIAQRWRWGVIGRALHWCELPPADALDCAMSAALARALWRRRCNGIVAVQLVERVDAPRWAGCHRDELHVASTGDRLAYHEAVGAAHGGRLAIWDCIDRSWRRPPPSASPGPVLGLRVRDAPQTVLRWGEHRLTPGSWNPIG